MFSNYLYFNQKRKDKCLAVCVVKHFEILHKSAISFR